jgi:hypothetical protein
MTTLILSFAIRLENSEEHPLLEAHGAQFHRWLPNGRVDAIRLDSERPGTRLNVWFERWGLQVGSFITFSYEHRDVPPEIMSRQAKLDSGPLMGSLTMTGIDPRIISCLRENRTGAPEYVELGKTAVRLIYSPVSRFLNIIRLRYGQYWVPQLTRWDSRNASLGDYCRTSLGLKWRTGREDTWKNFIPDEPVSYMSIIVGGTSDTEEFNHYLTKKDWLNLSAMARR